MHILSVNVGSSSVKFVLYDFPNEDRSRHKHIIFSGLIEGLEPHGEPRLCFTQANQKITKSLKFQSNTPLPEAIVYLKNYIHDLLGGATNEKIAAIAHRVVHGGVAFKKSVVINDAVIEELSKLNSLAPLHQPFNLRGIDVFRSAFPDIPQVACFDTSFHATLPELEYQYALPQSIRDMGVRRYGFHGLSYQYVQMILGKKSSRSQGRVLLAHLGNGASMAAVQYGKSCASSMGFSALDGLVMGTRCGWLDPGVILFLLEKGWTHDQIQQALYKESGLQGLSGVSADMRQLRKSQNPKAQFAIDIFTRRIIQEAGALTASLSGLDILAFTGGIGEHDALLRSDVCHALSYLGVLIDEDLNYSVSDQNEATAIHGSESSVEIWVIPTDEGYVAATEAFDLL